MKILLINQFFYPDTSATSQLLTDLAEDLVSSGMQVTVLCSQSGYLGETNASTDEYRNIQIIRLPGFKFRRSKWGRICSYLSFYCAVLFALLRMPRFDVTMVLTTPPLIALIPALVKRLRREKIVYVVQDLYPDIAFALGYIGSSGFLARSLDLVSRFCLRQADVVIAIGECMKDRLLRKGVRSERISVIQNWSNSDDITPMPKSENPFRATHGLAGKFVVLYSGNMGRAHDFATLIDAAKLLQRNEGIQFVFIGDGAKKESVELARTEYGLKNVTLLPYVRREDLSYSLGAADVCLVSQMPETSGLMVPSKIYGVMAAEKPIIFVGPDDSEAATSIKRHSCGFVIESGAADRLAAIIEQLAVDQDRVLRIGAQARSCLINNFDRDLLTRKYADVISQLIPVRTDLRSKPEAVLSSE